MIATKIQGLLHRLGINKSDDQKLDLVLLEAQGEAVSQLDKQIGSADIKGAFHVVSSKVFFKIKLFYFWILQSFTNIFIPKINNFRGDLRNILAETVTLVLSIQAIWLLTNEVNSVRPLNIEK